MSNTLLVLDTNHVMSDNTRDSMQDAAGRWKCDYIEFRDKGDFNYHGAAQKLRAFHICNHDRIFLIDSDTVIRHDTPSPFELVPPDKFGAVKNAQPHHPHIYTFSNFGIAVRDLNKIIQNNELEEYNIDIDYLANNFFNSGVVVLTRESHEEVLEYAWKLFVGAKGVQWWDQLPLNVSVLLKLGEYKDLGQGWNYMFPNSFHKMNAYIYHFAGNPSRYSILKTVNWRA